jgi:hypothetical protein
LTKIKIGCARRGKNTKREGAKKQSREEIKTVLEIENKIVVNSSSRLTPAAVDGRTVA